MAYKLAYSNDDLLEVGLDEAGRGCLFGRLYVGAVVLPKNMDDLFDHGAAIAQIKDSKVISERKRAIVYDYIQECAIDKSITYAECAEIDEYNVLAADMRAMHRALDALTVPVERILVDGNIWRPWKNEFGETVESQMIVHGDASYLSIAAAGILAKVSRDRWIEEICSVNPLWNEKYGLLKNKGYGTAAHRRGLSVHGATEEHRRSFAPVRTVLGLSAPAQARGEQHGRWLGE
jgi:ribonuclease HII